MVNNSIFKCSANQSSGKQTISSIIYLCILPRMTNRKIARARMWNNSCVLNQNSPLVFQISFLIFNIAQFSMTGFPCGSADKESTCNTGDLVSIPGLERFPGEGKNYPFQFSLEKGKTTHSSFLAWRIPWTVKSMESQRIGHD